MNALLGSVLAALLGPVLPADYFVDSTGGSDLTGTGTSTDPWKTITHALSQVPGPGDTIHVAAGVHGLSLGEVFPLLMKPGVSLVGAGSTSTTIDALGSAFAAVRFDALDFSPPTLFEGFRLTNSAAPALRVAASDPSGIRIVRNAAVGNGVGIRIDGVGSAMGPSMEENEFGFNASDVLVFAGPGGTTTSPRFRGDRIHHSTGHGFVVSASAGGSAIVTLEGIRIETNGGAGLWSSATAGTAILYGTNLTVFQNAVGGLVVSSSGAGALSLFLDHVTVADNAAGGVSVSGGASAAIANSIAQGNTSADLLGVPVASVTSSLVGTGSYAGQNGNIAGDPLFANRAAGNYALGAGSVCIDAGASSVVYEDAYADSRPIDGNFDGLAAPDMGSDELAHAHVEVVGAPTLGSTITLSLTGSPGVFARTYIAAGTGVLPIPYWGVLFLSFPVLPFGGVSVVAPATIPIPIPNDPALLGVELYLQPVGLKPVGFLLRGSLGNVVRVRIS